MSPDADDVADMLDDLQADYRDNLWGICELANSLEFAEQEAQRTQERIDRMLEQLRMRAAHG